MLIYKFGGSFLETKSSYTKIFRLIRRKIVKDKIVIVVSAIGRSSSFSTNSLLLETSHLDEQEKDCFLSLGEQYSSLKLTNYLKQKGINTKCVLANELDLINDKYYKELFTKHDCLVFPGYIEKDDAGYIKTLGRGGSDLSAIILANLLGLKDVYLNKETKGILSCNDDVISNKETIKYLSYDQAITYFTYSGELVQLKALELAKDNNINIHIVNLDNRFESIISDNKNE